MKKRKVLDKMKNYRFYFKKRVECLVQLDLFLSLELIIEQVVMFLEVMNIKVYGRFGNYYVFQKGQTQKRSEIEGKCKESGRRDCSCY